MYPHDELIPVVLLLVSGVLLPHLIARLWHWTLEMI